MLSFQRHKSSLCSQGKTLKNLPNCQRINSAIFDPIHFQLRKGVLELLTEEDDNKNYDLEVTTDEKTWREIMAKDTSAAIAVLKKKIEVRPRLLKLADFMGYFDTGA